MLRDPGSGLLAKSTVSLSFFLGTSIGASFSCLVLFGMSRLFPKSQHWSLLLATCIVIVALVGHDLTSRSCRLPQNRRLIPQQVFLLTRPIAAIRFGVEYGTALRTFNPSAAPYLLAIAVVVSRPFLLEAGLVAVCFGLGRSVGVWQSIFFGSDGWQNDVRSTSRYLERTASVLAGIGTALLAIGGIQ